MTDERRDQAALFLYNARQARRVESAIPAEIAPQNLEEAMAVQARLFQLLNDPRAGYFVGCSNPLIQKQLGLPGPYRAPLLSSTVHESPLTITAEAFPNIILEVEFAFRLGEDLPPRTTPYSHAEIAEAVVSLHPAIEIVASHLADWTHQPIWSIIADNGTDGGLVVGPGMNDWRGLARPEIQVTLSVNGEKQRQGTGADVLGDPLNVFHWLVNDCSAAGITLRAGEIFNTGSCTPMIAARAGDQAIASFSGLGEVGVSFT